MKNIFKLLLSIFFGRHSIVKSTVLTSILTSILTLALISTSAFSQGTLKENGKTIATIPVYDLSVGDTEWILNINQLYSYKWSAYFNFTSLAGTNDGTIAVFASCDDGISWVAYPSMPIDSVLSNGAISFDDSYTVFDKLKFVLTVNSISGGTVTLNQRLISNPK